MRAVLRFETILLAGALALLPGSALAQSTTAPPTTNAPSNDTVGPSELQNFSLPGTTTRPADQPPAAPVSTNPPARNEAAPAASAPPQPANRTNDVREPARTQRVERAVARGFETQPAADPVQPTPAPPQSSTAPTPQPSFSPGPEQQPADPAPLLTPEHKLSIVPWLIAAIALAAAAAFLLWWRRPRESFAGAPQIDLFAAPEPAPARQARPAPRPAATMPSPAPTPAPPPRSAAPVGGIVASRLRPSLEIGIQPLRCIVGDSEVTLEFEIDLFNAGTAPARAVLAEASMLNAGNTQEQELAGFFANPVGAGQRIDAIAPLKRVTLTSQVVAPRAAIQEYDLAGRRSFVPVLAFNALYEWSGGQGQTSAAYLVGRETGADKLGPLRLDSGTREFRAVGARPLPTVLRT